MCSLAGCLERPGVRRQRACGSERGLALREAVAGRASGRDRRPPLPRPPLSAVSELLRVLGRLLGGERLWRRGRRPESGSHSQRRAERREREGGGKGGERRQARRGETEKREREGEAPREEGGGRRLLEQLDGKTHEDEGAAGLQGGSEDGSEKGPGRAGRARVAANPLHLVERVGRIAQHLGLDGRDSSNRYRYRYR